MTVYWFICQGKYQGSRPRDPEPLIERFQRYSYLGVNHAVKSSYQLTKSYLFMTYSVTVPVVLNPTIDFKINQLDFKFKRISRRMVSQQYKSGIDSAAPNVRTWTTNEKATDRPVVKLLGVTPDDIRWQWSIVLSNHWAFSMRLIIHIYFHRIESSLVIDCI